MPATGLDPATLAGGMGVVGGGVGLEPLAVCGSLNVDGSGRR